ncbi:MAG: response regulator, partial [Spirochaetota bacterium]
GYNHCMKVMIVDDSVIMRKAIEMTLKNQGMQIVGQAADGEQAIQLFQEMNPEYVTMDITMPNMDGLTCIEELLKIDNSVKIIVVTALTQNGIALKALSLGAKAFINKPFTVEKVKEAFEKIMAKA